MSSNNLDSAFNEVAASVIKKYRIAKQMSLEDVVKKMNNQISRQSLYKYENNLARMKNNIFIDICNALNIDSAKVFQEINQQLTKNAGNASRNANNPIDFKIYDDNGNATTATVFGTKEMLDKYIKENNTINEFDILFDKTKDILSDDDRATIEFIMKKTIDNYEKNKNNQ